MYQVGENWVLKQNKCKNGLQRSQDSLETMRKRCYNGFFFLKKLSGMNLHYFKRGKLIFSAKTLLI